MDGATVGQEHLLSELLQIESLSVEFALSRAVVPALKGLSLTVGKGDKVGLLGESGCGKTTLALAILGVLPTKVAAMSGSIRLHGKELIGASEQTLRRVRGEQIAFIPQEPALALSPVFRAGEQVADVIRAHRPWRRRRCREEAREYLQTVGFETDVERVFASYPHQLSGGQRQRVAIAQAISCQPELLVADEPTTALDPTTQADILAMLRRLCRERGMSLLMISHDPAVLAEVVDRVVVIEDGRVVESGAMREVLEAPSHPYTRALLESAPERFALP